MFCSALSLTIKVGEYYIVCPREGGQIKAIYFTGYLLCPDYNLICTNTVVCNSNYDCFQKKSRQKETAYDYDYEIKTTQDPSIYEAPNPEISFCWEKADDGVCPQYCIQCTKSECIKCILHYKSENNKCLECTEHCQDYINDTDDFCNVCIKCKLNYFLVENSDGSRSCVEETKKNEYYRFTTALEIYKKCDIDTQQL